MYIVANQLELSNGTRRDRSECLVDAEQTIAPPLLQKRGSLFIITQTETMATDQPRPGDLELCREAQEIILNEYYNSQLTTTVTSALRQAIEKANQAIFNHNSATLPPERRGIGLTVALLRGNELYTAQLPPTQAFMVHGDELQPLPAFEKTAPRAVRPGGDAQPTTPRRQSSPSLGRHSLVEPIFQRNVFEDGDLLVLCSAQFAQALKEADLEWILSHQDSRNAMLNLSEFARNQGIQDGYVFTIGARPDFNSRTTQPHKPAEDSNWRNAAEGVAGAVGLFTSKRPKEPNEPTFAPGVSRKQPTQPRQTPPTTHDPVAPLENNPNDNWLHREDDDLNRPAYLRGRSLSNDAKPKSPQDGIKPPPAGPEVYQVGQPRAGQRDFTYTDASQEPPISHPAFKAPTPSIETEPDQDNAAGSNGNTSSRFSRPRRRPAPPVDTPYFDLVNGDGYGAPVASERRAPRRALPAINSRFLIIGGIAVVAFIVIIIVASAILGKVVDNSGGKAADLVKSAEQKRGAAQQAADTNPASARTLITQAQTDLDTARKTKPDLAELTTEQNAINVTLNNINGVVVPTDLKLAMDLSSQGTGVHLTSSVLSQTGSNLYLMDTGRGAIYSTNITGEVKTILKSGDKASGAVFGKPVKMVTRPDGLMVLDDGNILWIYTATGGTWTSQALGGTGGWGSKSVQHAASYQGNLYILGPGNGQILKYSSGGYGANPDEWLDPTLITQLDLDNAAGFSIDGTIYALTKDGKLVQLARKSGGDKGTIAQQFDLKASDRLGPPLSSPAVLNVGSLEFPYAFVIDSEKRLMQFSKADGSFVQQYEAAPNHTEFDNLQDVAIDENSRKIYIVGPQKVYVFSLSGSLAPLTNSTTLTTPTTGAQTTPGGGTTVTIINGQPTPSN